ncbi:MAG TPA: hypothetical protein PK082_05060 [Phycisphaerae bacterium]|nr:hypothetical protein [Phycisphaerae bacterium]
MSNPIVTFPEAKFYLFGMGGRRKMLYHAGVLRDALSGELIRQWDVAREKIDWRTYSVLIETAAGESIAIVEDGEGVWLAEGGDRQVLAMEPVTLPDFSAKRYGDLLGPLLHEVLINIVPAGPVPNIFVYRKPWYRDAAMMCMVLRRTGNLHLVRDWILSLRRPFDQNNGRHQEPDNLGELLYMISLVADRSHPLVSVVLKEVERFRSGRHLCGLTDGGKQAVYQTKWLKLGLRSLGLEDDFEIPQAAESYSSLFWMDFRDQHVPVPPFRDEGRWRYPYLAWAEAHFLNAPPPMELCGDRYPLTWEAAAGEANYLAMSGISWDYARCRVCLPHSWHAAEMFLYLDEL